jgi:small-conductance mechanosensitive channel
VIFGHKQAFFQKKPLWRRVNSQNGVKGGFTVLETFMFSHGTQYVVLRMLLVFSITILIERIFTVTFKKKKHDRLYFRMLYNITRAIIFVAGLFLMLYQAPIFSTGFLQTLLAGSGIAALAISLSAQESLGNFINGLVISASKPFEVGDRIRLVGGDITGWVEDITMRHTIIRTFMNSRVIIPNSVINKDMIENSNFHEARAAGLIDIVITYHSNLDLAIEIMQNVIGKHPNYMDPRAPGDTKSPKVSVLVRGLSIHGVELRASAWTVSIDNSFSTCSDIRRELKKEFDKSEIKFAEVQLVARN